MAHKEQINYVNKIKNKFPSYFTNQKVLGIGTFNVCGTEDGYFNECDYSGLDLGPGPGVDIVCPAQDYDAPDNTFDVIISCECFEHNPFYKETIQNAYRMLKPGGMFLFTCATTGRPVHGTASLEKESKEKWENWKTMPNVVRENWDNEYYLNLTEEDIRKCIDIDASFSEYEFEVETNHCDLFFYGFKNNRNMKIHIYQLHCNFSELSQNKVRPEWFDREKIFDSFVSTLDERVAYTAFHDSGNGELEDHFLIGKEVKIITQKGGSGAQSFLNLLNHVIEQKHEDDDIIYFLEDDYIHKQGWIDIMLEGFEYIDADYYTLYDHPNKYWNDMWDKFPSHILTTPSIHWRTAVSTTNTYACRFKTLKQHFDIHVQYCDLVAKWVKDHDKFTHLWNIGSNLVSCIPGYSAHVEGGMLSPITDWENILKHTI